MEKDKDRDFNIAASLVETHQNITHEKILKSIAENTNPEIILNLNLIPMQTSPSTDSSQSRIIVVKHGTTPEGMGHVLQGDQNLQLISTLTAESMLTEIIIVNAEYGTEITVPTLIHQDATDDDLHYAIGKKIAKFTFIRQIRFL